MKFHGSLASAALLSLAVVGGVEALLPRALTLTVRQNNCFSNEKECGAVCIPLSYTCCPDGSGGCPASEYCSLQPNNEYGCCPLGETCVGDGGAITFTDTITNTITTSYAVTTTSTSLPVTTTTSVVYSASSTTAPMASYTPGSANVGTNTHGRSSGAVVLGCSAMVAALTLMVRFW